MNEITFREKDVLVMKLLHLFVAIFKDNFYNKDSLQRKLRREQVTEQKHKEKSWAVKTMMWSSVKFITEQDI